MAIVSSLSSTSVYVCFGAAAGAVARQADTGHRHESQCYLLGPAPTRERTGCEMALPSSTVSGQPKPVTALSTPVRLVRLVVSWALVGIGVPLLIRAELGVAPFDVLNTGLSETTGWSLGLAFVVNSVIFFTTGAILGARLGPACVGGTLVIAVAICLVVTTEFGPGPTETVMLGLIHRGMGTVPARWIADGVPLAVGAALGGQIGVGTVVFLAAMGPLVKFGLRTLGYQPTQRAVETVVG